MATPAPTTPVAPTSPQKPFKKRATTWLLGAVALLLVGFIVYRWAGTSTYRGTVQRVYEKENEFRAEIVDLEGHVHVVGNKEITFPYFKLDTADLHADLNRLSKTRDVVDVKFWCFRFTFVSVFPNVIETEFVMSRQDRDRKRSERIADAVLESLRNKGHLKGGEGVRDDIVRVVGENLGNE